MKLPMILFVTIGMLGAAGLTPVNLRVESEANPVGVSASPRFAWNLSGEGRGGMQKGYELLAASSLEKLTPDSADLWKSKMDKSSQRSLLAWQGSKLKENQKVYWKVRVIDQKGQIGEWSKVAYFTVGKDRKLGPAAQLASFQSSSEVLNGIFKRNVATLKKRLDGYLQGDVSALGTGHQVQRSARDLIYLFESIPALNDWIGKVHAGQNKLGYFPGGPKQMMAPVHSDAAIAVPHTLWWMSGDPSLVAGRWDQMEKHMVRREESDPTIQGISWGAPLKFKNSPSTEFIDLCYFGMTSRLMYELAAPASKPNNSIRYRDYSARIRRSFKKQYLAEEGQLKIPGQSAAVLALRSSVMDAATRQPVIDSLLKDLGGIKDVGNLSAKPLLPVLSLTGNQQKAFELVSDSKSPWADPARKDFEASGVVEWMMSTLAGIDTRTPGFRQFHVSPNIPEGDTLTWVKSSYRAPSGEIKVHWEKKEKALHVKCTVPNGALAIITLPLKEGEKISEGGKTVKESFGAEIMKKDSVQGMVSIIAQAGTYHFVID
ncbi:MAG: alpha-L-rhamnosidase C-terminal domain-containing protein [Akkermansiaceae bacterium]